MTADAAVVMDEEVQKCQQRLHGSRRGGSFIRKTLHFHQKREQNGAAKAFPLWTHNSEDQEALMVLFISLFLTFPVRLMVGVVEVVALLRRVEVVHVNVKVVRRLPEVVLALVQRQADARGGELLPLRWASLQG